MYSSRVSEHSRGGARLAAFIATLISGAAYLTTMYPGLVGIGDTPKLQFVGSVLGTPHSPGYPLYIVLSWLFSHLPIGTIAYRMNLLSAASGAAAAGLMTLALVELGCRPAVAAAGALAVAFGDLFWSQAILAEVYALNAALFAAVLLYLARWARTGAPRHLYVAIAVFGLGLAHHLTLAMTGPALLLFALAVNRRIMTPRVVAVAVAACALGLACYGLLWLRTRQGAAFLEVEARSIGDLVAIVSGRQFQRALFWFTPRELLVERLPLVTRWIAGELRWPGLVMAIVGAVAWWRYGRTALGLLAGCAAMVSFFALNYNVFDVQVFLLIPMIAVGLIAALGLETLARQLDRAGVPAALAVAIVWLLPYAQYCANVRRNDQHLHRYEMAYFDALFEQLPDRSAIVSENYPINSMVRYKLIAEHAARGRHIALIEAEVPTIQRYLDDGYTVFAFSGSRESLDFEEGVAFEPADLTLPAPRSMRHVADTEATELAFGLAVAKPLNATASVAWAEDRRP